MGDVEKESVFITNEEVRSEFVRAVRGSGWSEVMNAITASKKRFRKADNTACN